MIALLDANALLALGWPSHGHHETVIGWMEAHRAAGWATCSVTESAFLRLSLNPRVVKQTLPSIQVVAYMRRLFDEEDHVFLTDDVSLPSEGWIDWEAVRGHRQVTDLHLVALAVRHDARLVTLDRGVLDLVPETLRGHIVHLG